MLKVGITNFKNETFLNSQEKKLSILSIQVGGKEKNNSNPVTMFPYANGIIQKYYYEALGYMVRKVKILRIPRNTVCQLYLNKK